jgi:hypothetical protein
MHPLASADEIEESASSKQMGAKIAFMVVLPGQDGPTGQVGIAPLVPSHGVFCCVAAVEIEADMQEYFSGKLVVCDAHRTVDESM